MVKNDPVVWDKLKEGDMALMSKNTLAALLTNPNFLHMIGSEVFNPDHEQLTVKELIQHIGNKYKFKIDGV